MNAVVSEPDAGDEVEFRAPGPGERLKNARLAKEFDLARMADRLHLTVDMVEALECDDYSEMPARVFVRGYIRNYARVVELPADSVVGQFDQLWPEDEQMVRINKAPHLPADSRPAKNWAAAMTWLLAIAGLALFLVWWQGYLDRFTAPLDGSPATQDSLQAPPQPGDAGLALPAQPAEASEGAEPAEPALLQGSGELQLPRPLPLEPPVVDSQAPVEPQVTAVQPTVEAEPVAEPEQASTVAAQAEAPAGPVVTVSFSEDCWVDIRDSSRSFRLFGTMRKGSQKVLEGEPPYKMVLGNAAAVSVLVDGEPFDLTPYSKDNIARLSFNP